MHEGKTCFAYGHGLNAPLQRCIESMTSGSGRPAFFTRPEKNKAAKERGKLHLLDSVAKNMTFQFPKQEHLSPAVRDRRHRIIVEKVLKFH